MTRKYPIIPISPYLYMVDREDNDTQDGDWRLHEESEIGKAFIWEVKHAAEGQRISKELGIDWKNSGRHDPKIIASNNPLLKELPQLTPVESNDKDWDKFICDNGLSIVPFNVDDIQFTGKRIKELLTICYKAASNSNRYSEEDVWKIMETIAEKGISTTPYSRDWPWGKREAVKEIINSLKKQPIAVEVEMECGDYGEKDGLRYWPKVDNNNKIIIGRWIYE